MTTIHSFFASDLGKALLPPLGAIIVAAIGAAIGWAKDLSGTARRVRQLEEATKRIEFWQLWLKTLSGVTGGSDVDNAAAVREMRIAAVRLKESFAHSLHARHMTVTEFRDYKKKDVGAVRQFLMLYEEPSTTAAKWRRFIYLFLLVLIAEGVVLDEFMRGRVLAIIPDLPRPFQFVGLTAAAVALGNFFYTSRKIFVKEEEAYLAEMTKREAQAIGMPENAQAEPPETTAD